MLRDVRPKSVGQDVLNLQANLRVVTDPPSNLGKRRRPRRSLAVQIRLAPQELEAIQGAAARWAADVTTPPSKPAASSPRRRYSAVPRYIRAQVLAAAAAEAPGGDEGRAELEVFGAFRLEVRRVGRLLNQALAIAHSGRGTGLLVGAINEVGDTVGEILKAVKAR